MPGQLPCPGEPDTAEQTLSVHNQVPSYACKGVLTQQGQQVTTAHYVQLIQERTTMLAGSYSKLQDRCRVIHACVLLAK